MRKLAIVVAAADGGVIGKEGGLPWKLPEDLRHFKNVTMGHAMIMGRKTYDSIGRALPGRTSFVISRTPGLAVEGCTVASSLGAALTRAWEIDEEPRVIGGAMIYEASLPLATKIFLTEVHRRVDGDTFFRFERSGWRETERRQGETPDIEFVVLERDQAAR